MDYCYACLQQKQDLSDYTPKNLPGLCFPVCEDCLEQDFYQGWTEAQWKARPDEYAKKGQAPSVEQEKKVAPSSTTQPAELEESKESDRSLFILLGHGALQYSLSDATWKCLDVTLDFDTLEEHDKIAFSLISSSAQCVQILGSPGRDALITGGLLYSQLSFFATVEPSNNSISLKAGPNLVNPRYQHAMAGREVGGETVSLFIAGGLQDTETASYAPVKSVEQLELKEGKWKEIGQLIEPRVSSAAVVVGEMLYVIGGLMNSKTNNYIQFLEAIDLKTGGSKAVKIRLAQSMPFPLAGFQAMLEPGEERKVLLFGGTDQSVMYRQVFRLDLESNELSLELKLRNTRADFIMGKREANSILLVGGAESDGESESVDWASRTSTPVFSYAGALGLAGGQLVEFPDLRWSCAFMK